MPRGASGPGAPAILRWADLLGDESESAGKHHTRHADAENNFIRAFGRVTQAANADLQNAKE